MYAAAAAKSLQSCPTLCDPIDGSPSDSPVPGILQARTLEWVAISCSNAWKWKVKVKSLNHVRLLVTPRTAAYQASLSIGFSRQEYWSGVPLPSPYVHASWGKLWTKRYKKTKQKPKKPTHQTATSKDPGAKTVYSTCALHTPPPKGWAIHLSHPSGPICGHTPTITPCKEPVACYSSPLLQWGPERALPRFLDWPLVNFCWLRRAKKPGQCRFQIILVSFKETEAKRAWNRV